MLKIGITKRQAAQGIVKTVQLADGRGVVRVRLPAGIPSGALIRISAPGEPNELFARVTVRPQFPKAPFLAGGIICLIVVVTWISMSGGGEGSSSDVSPAATGTAASAPSTSAVPVVTPGLMSTADYKAILVGINSALALDLDSLGKARSADSIDAALAKLGADAHTQASSLSVNAPLGTATANATLETALKSFGGDVVGVKTQVDQGHICNGEAAVAAITRSAGATALRGAAPQLASADASFANAATAFLPGAIADQNRRLANGASLRHSSGSSALTITAGNQDVVVTLVPSGGTAPTASIYVRSGSTTELTGVPTKSFKIYLAEGTDWDTSSQHFARDCAFSLMAGPTDFSQGTYNLTLRSSTSTGATTSTPVPPGQYPGP